MKKLMIKFVNKASYLITKHWIVTAIFLTGSSWWFSLFIGYLGYDFHLIEQAETADGVSHSKLTMVGLIWTIAILVLLLF